MFSLLDYNPSNKLSVLELFDSNVPDYFDDSEKEHFIQFLDVLPGEYFVCYNPENRLIGAGGYCRESEKEARICWLMIEDKFHGNGAGKYMMQAFYERILASKEFRRITLKTSQFTYRFYEKLGYKTTLYEKDHWFKGMDLYFMEMSI